MSPDLIAAAAKLIGVLVFIVGGLLAFNVYSRRFLRTGLGTGSKAVQVLESTPIGLKKAVTLVKVPGAVLVVGVTNDRISLLDRMEEADFRALSKVDPSPPGPTFQDHLRRFTGRWQSKPIEADGTDASGATSC